MNKDETDNIDAAIEKAIHNQSFDISCPSRNDNRICPSIYGLAKLLIKYKRWLLIVNKKTNGKTDIDKTVQVDYKGNIDNDKYKEILMDTVKTVQHKLCTEEVRDKIINMVSENQGNIAEIDTYLSIDRKAFATLIKEHCKVKPGMAYKI